MSNFRNKELAEKMIKGEVPIDSSIKVKDYKERPEKNYSQMGHYQKNIAMFFKNHTRLLYPPTEAIYKYIRNTCIDIVKNHPQYPKFNWKPKIADVGCGGGFGSYILSHEADFVWGIDADEKSIKFAKACYEKYKNNIYYSSQLTFDVIDILDEPRELMAFDIVACIEVLEHIYDYNRAIEFLKKLCKKDKRGEYFEPPDATIVYVSSPNRNYFKMGKKMTKNAYHVREWSAEELYGILIKHFKYVTLMDVLGVPQELDTTTSVLLFKCEVPIHQQTT